MSLSTLALPCVTQATTHDFDDQATLLAGWNQHYLQLSSGRFQGDIIEVRFDDVHLFAESTNQALYQSGKLAQGNCAIGVPLRVPESGTFCGESMRPGTAHVFSGESGFEFYSPTRLIMGGISLPEHALPDWLRDKTLENTQAGLKSVNSEVLQAAGDFLSTVLALCKQRPELLQSANFRKQIRSSVLCCVTDLLDDDFQAGDLTATPQKRWSLVRQAREILHEAEDGSMDVEQLCRTLGVSRRTLQYCFQDQVGMNPVAYLRTQRLNGVRRMLKQGHHVTDAATTWGFWHFGHFSQEYKKLFGELPSETLRRYSIRDH